MRSWAQLKDEKYRNRPEARERAEAWAQKTAAELRKVYAIRDEPPVVVAPHTREIPA